MAVNSSEECQNAHCVVVLPDGGETDLQNAPPPDTSHIEVPKFLKSEMCLNSAPSFQNNTNLKVDIVKNYAPCIILDADVEKGKSDKCSEESVLKSDDSLVRALQREIFLQTGGKFMQLLMNLGTDIPKFTSRVTDKSVAEKLYDTSVNRSRKYKRSPSFNFNSRRIVILFSVLSSLGTIILIYLTLRVRQISDGSVNV